MRQQTELCRHLADTGLVDVAERVRGSVRISPVRRSGTRL